MKTKNFQNCLGVFQGGGCKGIAFVGAYEEALSRGVFFSQIAGTSAGAILAVLIGAGASPAQLHKILKQLKFDEFKKPPIKIEQIRTVKLAKYFPVPIRFVPTKDGSKWDGIKKFIQFLGAYSSEYIEHWVEAELQKLLGKTETILFKDLLVPTIVLSTDIKSKGIKLWSTESTPDAKVSSAVRSSCSIPFYFQPFELQYVDGGLLSNLPSFTLEEHTIYDKILAFSFEGTEPEEYVIGSCEDFFKRLINTTIDGATDIQLRMQKNVYQLKINTGDIQATDFEKINQESIQALTKAGKTAAVKFFEGEDEIIADFNKRNKTEYELFQTYNFLIKYSENKCKEILISYENTEWVYSLFPLLVKWVSDQADIKVVVTKDNQTTHDLYRKRLLEKMNVAMCEVDQLSFSGFLINANSSDGHAIITTGSGINLTSRVYSVKGDNVVVDLLRNKFHEIGKFSAHNYKKPLRVVAATLENYSTLLKNVRQYSDENVSFGIEEIEIDEALFLTRFIKGYKYRQLHSLIDFYSKVNIKDFYPARFEFSSTEFSLITPPVVEEWDGKYIVVEGNARFALAHKRGIKKINCIVVKNVSENLPTQSRFNIKELLITDKKTRGSERYPKFNYSAFRHIEEEIHNPHNSLI